MKNLPLITGLVVFGLLWNGSQISAQVQEQDSSGHFRLENIRSIALKDASSVNRWWWGWLSGYSAATIGQSVTGMTAGKQSLRQDMFLGAATTLIGAAGQFFTAVQPVKLHLLGSNEKSTFTAGDNSEIYMKYLKSMAEAEKKGRGWQIHMASGVVNLGSGLVTWLGFKRTFKEGLVNFALNTVITEAQIWSQPVKAKKYWSTLSKEGIISESSSGKGNSGYSLLVGSTCNGIQLSFRF
jgi:hypothetical protein